MSVVHPRPSAQPLVSVVVATRNRPGPLRNCLQAIASQTCESYEVVVVDDGSNEETRAVYPTLGPELGDRLTWLLPKCPDVPGTGPAAARNRGIRASRGTFLAFCDDDDRWIRPDHLACAVRALETTGRDFFFSDLVAARDGVVSDYVWFPERDRLLTGTRVLEDSDVVVVDVDTVLRAVSGSVIHPDCWVVRKSLLDNLGGFWERLWFFEDYDLMMRLLDRTASVMFRPEPCVEYRLPATDSVSATTAPLETIAMEVLAATHVRLVCERAPLRRAARAREAWAFRQIAKAFRATGRHQEAWKFGWAGLSLYPTFGAVWELISQPRAALFDGDAGSTPSRAMHG